MRTCGKQANLFGSTHGHGWIKHLTTLSPWIFLSLSGKRPLAASLQGSFIVNPTDRILLAFRRAAGVWPDFCLVWQRVHYVIGEELMQ